MKETQSQSIVAGGEQYREIGATKKFIVSNIQAIPASVCEMLECGDIVVKKTVDGSKELFHTYMVSHKQATGLCITYTACGYIETVSFDKIGGVWTYNSTDVWQAE